jgi:hypothetical protein
MWRKYVASAAGTVAWGMLLADAVSEQFELDPAGSNFILGVGCLALSWIMLCARNRPVAAAYELGFERGRREVMLAANGRDNVVHLAAARRQLAPEVNVLADADL